MQNDSSGNEERDKRLKEACSRFKVIKIYDVDDLILLFAKILSMLKNKQQNFNVKMIVVDSLSSLFCGVTFKQ